jgi:hypothetical protein
VGGSKNTVNKQNSSSLGRVVVRGSEIKEQNSSSLGTVAMGGSENKESRIPAPF